MVKEIALTRGYVALVDDEDFDYLKQWSWYAFLQPNGRVYGKRTSRENGVQKSLLMHRVLLDITSKLDVDHINHNGLDNRRNNLRVCTRSQNIANQRAFRGKSRYKGVSPGSYGFCVRIGVTGKIKQVGFFKNEIEAAKAYDKAAFELYGEFAHLNFPEEVLT